MRPRLLVPIGLLAAVGGAGRPVLFAADIDPAHAFVVDSIVVEKAERRLSLLDARGIAVRVYTGIQLGDEPIGPKHFEGDERTPEGHYTIDRGNPDSAYHLSLHISYPDSNDRDFARARGRNPGGAIFIHGQPNGVETRPSGDWTDGCIALSNLEIEEIWSLVGDGTPIDIHP